MVRVTLELCDLHYPDHEHAGKLTDALGINDRWYEILLGDEKCKKELDSRPYSEVIEFFRNKGTESRDFPKNAKRQGGLRKSADPNAEPAPCLWCPEVSISPTSLSYHLRSEHGFKDLDQAYGPTCPDCGSDYARISSHTSRAHGMQAPNLFKEVEKEGDPKGVVKTRREALAA